MFALDAFNHVNWLTLIVVTYTFGKTKRVTSIMVENCSQTENYPLALMVLHAFDPIDRFGGFTNKIASNMSKPPMHFARF